MDARAFARGVAEDALMERAAGHLARSVREVGGRTYGLRVGLVCGKGNNGADGLAAARLLRRAGAHPLACVVDGADTLEGLPAVQRDRLLAAGGRLVADPRQAVAGADVVVDALLGTGASGALRSPYLEAVEALAAAGVPVVACDIPTGVDAATGAVDGPAVVATRTVTLGAEKVGLRLWPARGHCGDLVVGDLGIVEDDDDPAAVVLDDADAAAALPPPDAGAHKRSRGTVVVLAGSDDMRGAAVLAARGALAGGAGLVTVATTPAARESVATAVPEALTLALPAEPDAAHEALEAALDRADALVVGPGLGLAEPTVALVRRVVAEAGLPLVLDADGLNAFADEPAALGRHASPRLVLTPHAGELARLAGPDAYGARASQATGLAERWQATLLLKGPGTLVAEPDGRVFVTASGTAALATGGTGDVLSGLLGAALAGAPERGDVVAAAAHLHGRAGERAAEWVDGRSVTAGAVAEALGPALARLRGRDGGGPRR